MMARMMGHPVPSARKLPQGAMLLLSALVAAIVGMAVPVAAYAQGASIAYNAATDELTANGQSGGDGVDLFPAFKGVMPGDAIEQDIVLDLTHVTAPTRVHVQAHADDHAKKLLGDVSLSVSLDGDSNGIEATSSPMDVFAQQTLLLQATSDYHGVLHVTLRVPVEVGNEVADALASVAWTVTVEEDASSAPGQVPHGSQDSDGQGQGAAGQVQQSGQGAGAVHKPAGFLVQTGDSVYIYVLVACTGVGLVACGAALTRRSLRQR